MTKVYLALYKGKKIGNSPSALLARSADFLVRKFTKGIYSHCELALKSNNQFICYSSSIREGGVRRKVMNLDKDKWDLIELHEVTEKQIESYFKQTKGMKYDFWGAIGIVLGIKQKRSKFFCSEWFFNAIKNSDQGWRFSPNHIAVIFKGLSV
ncbi:TPA: enoyl-CoA hydratase [Pasteurella multocida]|nr:enoyl-CoA hydratase [Pasteurella multocida]